MKKQDAGGRKKDTWSKVVSLVVGGEILIFMDV